jgi:uncharacterized protein DUF5678
MRPGVLRDMIDTSTLSYAAQIRELVEREHIPAAKRLVEEALRSGDPDPALLKWRELLAPPLVRSFPHRENEPRRERELSWLEAHAHEYPGQWVAVEGDRLLGHAETLRELKAALPTDSPGPLVVRFD